MAPQVIVVVAYGKLLPDSILAIPPKTVLNLHPALLPRYRGASSIAFPILNGDQVTGVTIMQVNSGFDSGPVLAHPGADDFVLVPCSTAELAKRMARPLARSIQAAGS